MAPLILRNSKISHRPFSKLPDVSQLRAALAVWRDGGVTRAADRIGLSQPAVSRLVAALEEELGFALFERKLKRLTVSERGRAFLLEVETTLGSLSHLKELAVELRRGHRGLLRIAAVTSLAHGLVPRILAALQSDFPNLALEVEELNRDQQIEGLLSHQLDVGLISLPCGTPELQVEMIAQADAVCLLPSAHPLARMRATHPAVLSGEPFVRLNKMTLLQKMVDDAFSRAGKPLTASIVVDNTPLMIGFVADGLGLAITHGLSAMVLPKGVAVRPFLPSLGFHYGVLTRKADKPSPVVAAFTVLARGIAANALQELRAAHSLDAAGMRIRSV
jgi:DNA-binding transcriptional LysR family regulator